MIRYTPRSKRPVSSSQLAANRANAARSTGPRTPEGKARSAQNSRCHGFAAADFAVVRLEDLQAVANLKHDLVAVCQSANSRERIALSQQALVRLARGPDLQTRSIPRPALKLTLTPNATGHFPAK